MFTIGSYVTTKDEPEIAGVIMDFVTGEHTEGRTVLVRWSPRAWSYEYKSELTPTGMYERA